MLSDYVKTTRLTLPFDVWTIVVPCWMGVFFASLGAGSCVSPWEVARVFGLFTLMGALMLGVGCTYDDIVDMKIDAAVSRTKDRPIASGKIPLVRAWIFLFLQMGIALALLSLFPPDTFLSGLFAGACLAVYPFIKRFSYFAGVFLAFFINMGAPIAYMALKDPDGVMFLAYGACFFWTLYYIGIYEMQDLAGDRQAGVKSIAMALGRGIRPYLAVSLVLMFACLAAAGYSVGLTAFHQAGLAGCFFLFLQPVLKIDSAKPDDCYKYFHHNRRNIFAVMLVLFSFWLYAGVYSSPSG